MAAVAAVWHESLCPRRHLHSECSEHGHTQHVHPDCDTSGDHHHHRRRAGQEHHHDGNHCSKTCRSESCKGCMGCKISCPVCLLMMSVVLLMAPPSAAAVAQCGGHGALLTSSPPTCACDPGYVPRASDSGTCVPDSDAPGSWAAMFARGEETPAEHMWALMGKTQAQPLSGNDAVRMMDMISGVYVDDLSHEEGEHHDHEHDHGLEEHDHDHDHAVEDHDHDHGAEEHDHEEAHEHDHAEEEHAYEHEDEHAHEGEVHELEGEHALQEGEHAHEEGAHEYEEGEHAHDEEHAHEAGEEHAHEEGAAECSGHGHLHGSECHCDEGWMMSSSDPGACVPLSAGRRMLAEQMCGGHGHPEAGGCHCDSGYIVDPSDNLNCLPSTSSPSATGARYSLTIADLIAVAGVNGVLHMENLTAALPLIASCQMDSTCALEVTQLDLHAGHDHGSGGGPVQPWMASVAAILFFVIPVIAIMIPFILSRLVSGRTFAMLFSLGNCFSSGLIFSLGVMHIIPHTMESQWAVGIDYPLNFLLITVGFFVTLFLEQVPGLHSSGSPLVGVTAAATRSSVSGSPMAGQSLPMKGVGPCCTEDHAHKDPPVEGMPAEAPPSIEDGMQGGTGKTTSSSPPSFTVMQRLNALMPALVFFVASQFHACLEAFFVGVTSQENDFWIFVGAVCTHKFFVALSFGMKVYALWGTSDAGQRWTLAVMSALWAALPALCVVIGYVIASSISALSQLVLTSLAAGTFLYIGSFEILSEEFVHSHGPSPCDQHATNEKQWGSKPAHTYFKFVAITVAIAVVALTSLIPHTH